MTVKPQQPLRASPLRVFHNWIKQQLFQVYVHPHERVVDIGSGKGGDLSKVHRRQPKSVLNIDISADNIRDAQARCQQLGDASFAQRLTWFVGDMREPEAFEQLIHRGVLVHPESVHVFCAHFVLPYLFGTAETLDRVLQWISTFLINGGILFGTMLDGGRTLELLQSMPNETYRSALGEISVERPASTPAVAAAASTFGRRVMFKLHESVTARNVNEYLVDWDTLVTAAARHDLILAQTRTFDEWYRQYPKSDLSAPELQISYLNRSFVFVKARPTTHSSSF